jgi:hypothetical protein
MVETLYYASLTNSALDYFTLGAGKMFMNCYRAIKQQH